MKAKSDKPQRKKASASDIRRNGNRDQSKRRISVLLKSIATLQKQVSDYQRVEKDLRTSEERFMLASMGNGEGVWDYDFSTQQFYLSPSFREILGLGSENLPAKLSDFERMIHPDDKNSLFTTVREHWEQRSPLCTVEYRIKGQKNEYIWVRSRGTTLWSTNKKPLRMVGNLVDITRERGLEEQFRQAQKMEAVGQFAGGIAHDFNNIIGIVLGYSDLLLRKLSKEDPSRVKIEAIRSAGQKAAQITKQLLAFSRRQLLQPQVIDLNAHLRESSKMIRCLLNEDIEVKIDLCEKEARLKVDPNCLEQIIVNLVINSRDALLTGGAITIKTKISDCKEEQTKPYGVAPGMYVMLEVKDTGQGISPEILVRIFEPFFTTKATGKGTGLGLSTVYGIVKQNAGFIQVQSEVGKGSSFQVYFPQSNQMTHKNSSNNELEEPPRGGETILIVEDEDWLRSLAYEILTGQGYTVFEVRNGDEALQLCSHESAKIDLVFTDIVMPKRDGMGLWDRLQKIRPEVKILFTSGYPSKHLSFQEEVIDKQLRFITKPYDLLSLSKKIREVLDS